jgi:hypothetical protein
MLTPSTTPASSMIRSHHPKCPTTIHYSFFPVILRSNSHHSPCHWQEAPILSIVYTIHCRRKICFYGGVSFIRRGVSAHPKTADRKSFFTTIFVPCSKRISTERVPAVVRPTLTIPKKRKRVLSH